MVFQKFQIAKKPKNLQKKRAKKFFYRASYILIYMKSTKVIVRANNGSWMVSANQSPYISVEGNTTFTCVGSNSGDVDVTGEFYNSNIILQFEMNNPWIGYPWAAVGPYIGDSGWKNDRTSLSEGESHIFVNTIYGDDYEFDFKTRVIRLADTDTKNFELWIDWSE
jgi:hypothetical protein